MKCTNPVPDPKQTHGHTWGADYYQCSYCKLEFDEYINLRDAAKLPTGFQRFMAQSATPSGIPVEIKCECGVDSIQGSFEPHSFYCPKGGSK